MKTDIVLANIPRTDPNAPYLGTFLLKSVIEKNGFTCKTFDWNRDLYDKVSNQIFFDRSNVCFDKKEYFDYLWKGELNSICNGWLKQIKKYNPDWFGTTVMSKKQELMCRKLLGVIRQKFPHIKIMVGGFYVGMYDSILGSDLKREGLVDYFVTGEGENAIIDILKGNYNVQGVNTKEPTIPPDLNLNPTPNYEDVSHFKYRKYYAYTSRGCINNCSFCTEKTYSRGYRYRKAELIVEDMLASNKATGCTRFFFADSLINGVPKEFKKLIRLLDGKGFKWGGQYACNEWMTEKDYEIAAKAGLDDIAVGFESPSERIRKEMKKFFSNKAMYQTIEWATKYKIRISPMFIIGWPTETEKEFKESLDFLTYLEKYKKYIREVNPGITLAMDRSMDCWYQFDGVYKDDNNRWVYKDNNYSLRQDRWFRFVEHCKNIKLKVSEIHRKTVEEKRSVY